MPIHKCGPCGGEFESERDYLNHECPKAGGAKPTNPEYLKKTTTPQYDAIAAKALENGAAEEAK